MPGPNLPPLSCAKSSIQLARAHPTKFQPHHAQTISERHPSAEGGQRVGHRNSSKEAQPTAFFALHDSLTRNIGNFAKCILYLVIDQPPIEWGAGNWSHELIRAYCKVMEILGPQLEVFGFLSAGSFEPELNFAKSSLQTRTLTNTLKSKSITRLFLNGVEVKLSVFLSFPESLKRLELISMSVDKPKTVTDANKRKLQRVFARLEELRVGGVDFDSLLELLPSPSVALGGIRSLYVKESVYKRIAKSLVLACSKSLELLVLNFTEGWGNRVDLKNAKKLRTLSVIYPIERAPSIGLVLQTLQKRNSKLEEINLVVTHQEYAKFDAVFGDPNADSDSEGDLEKLDFVPDSVVTVLVSPSLESLTKVEVKINISKRLKKMSSRDQKRIRGVIFGDLVKRAKERSFQLDIGTDMMEELDTGLLVNRVYYDVNEFV
ncbi:hypothetical protein BDQ17DRAFT_1428832 [Cyathus striatus]|nr:hypothetical protein BDQ17DRAFT_1428832 [Cyathus striatus]